MLGVRIDRDLASDLGVSLSQIGATLGSLPITQSGATGSNGMIRLDQVVQIVQSQGPGEILRQDL